MAGRVLVHLWPASRRRILAYNNLVDAKALSPSPPAVFSTILHY